jgi:hypothetical protein
MSAPGNRLAAWQWLACAAIFFAVALAVGWRSLAYDFQFDDLHLVRTYSGPEIAGAFKGAWDPDGIETKGLRPLTTLFNDARSRVFGEWTTGHRLFLIALCSLYLAGLTSIAARLGSRWWVGLVAGVLTLCAKNSYYHTLWPSDGIHLVPAVFFVGAVHLLFAYFDSNRTAAAAGSALLLLCGLAAREDALALFGIAVLMGSMYLWQRGQFVTAVAFRQLARYAVVLFCAFLPFWTWRLLVVPRAPNFRANLGVLTQPLTMFHWTLSLVGQGDPLRIAFDAAFAILLVVTLTLVSRNYRRRALFWLALAALACLPGAVYARTNLLLFPVSFYALFVATVLEWLVATRPAGAAVAALVLTLAALAGVRASRLEQASMHAMSTDKLSHDWFALYSTARFNSIPPERRARTKAGLDRLGIGSEFDFRAWEEQLRSEGRVGLIDDGRPFVPARKFLTP